MHITAFLHVYNHVRHFSVLSTNFHRIFHAYNRVSNAYTRFSTHIQIQTFRTHTCSPHILVRHTFFHKLSQATQAKHESTQITSTTSAPTFIRHTGSYGYHIKSPFLDIAVVTPHPSHKVPPTLGPGKITPAILIEWEENVQHRTGPTHRTKSQLLSHQSLHRSCFPPKVVLHI